jgi:hypothetical protein
LRKRRLRGQIPGGAQPGHLHIEQEAVGGLARGDALGDRCEMSGAGWPETQCPSKAS